MNQVRALAIKELVETRWRILISVLFMSAIAVSIPLMFDWVREMIEGVAIPERWAGMVHAQLASYRVYLWANWWGKNHYQMMSILALVWGMGIIARERASGTLAYILSRPVTRARLLAVKYGVGAASLALISLLSTLVLVLVSGAVRGDGVPWFVMTGYPQALLGILAVFSLATLFSALTRDQVMALVGAGVTAVVVSVLGWFPSLRAYSPFVQMAAPRTLATGRLDLVAIAGLTLGAAVLYVVAAAILERAEL